MRGHHPDGSFAGKVFQKGSIPWNKGACKYDVEKLGIDYLSGLSLNRLNQKYGISISRAYHVLNERNLIRPVAVANREPWRDTAKIKFRYGGMNDDLGYLLGVYLGDGYIYIVKSKSQYLFGLHAKDKEFIESFSNHLKNLGFHVMHKRDDPYNRVELACKEFVLWVKSLDLNKIENILGNDEGNIKAFIRGFYDSEGSICVTRRGKVELVMSNTNVEILNFVKKCSARIGIPMHICLSAKAKGKWRAVYHLYSRSSLWAKIFLEKIKPTIPRKTLNSLEQKLSGHPKPIRLNHTPEQYKKALNLYHNGFNDKKISSMMGISESTIQHWIDGRYTPLHFQELEEVKMNGR